MNSEVVDAVSTAGTQVLPLAPTRMPIRDQTTGVAAHQTEPCSRCHGMGWLRNPNFGPNDRGRWVSNLVACDQCGTAGRVQADKLKRLYGDAHIPIDYRDCTIETFPTAEATLAQLNAFHLVQGWLKKAMEQEAELHHHGLYIYGEKTGVGKTGMAISCLHAALSQDEHMGGDGLHLGFYLPMIEMLDTLRDGIGSQDYDTRKRADDLMSLLLSIKWVVLDDFGVENTTPYVMERIYRILNARKDYRLFTIFTSNLDEEELRRKWHAKSPSGATYYEERLLDRLGVYCYTVEVKGKNLRLK